MLSYKLLILCNESLEYFSEGKNHKHCTAARVYKYAIFIFTSLSIHTPQNQLNLPFYAFGLLC